MLYSLLPHPLSFPSQVLIQGFRPVLTQRPSRESTATLQDILLSLIQVIGQSQISATELRQFLSLFKDNTETSGSLLSALMALVDRSKVTPMCYATFPAKTLMPLDMNLVEAELLDSGPASQPQEQAVWHHAAVEMEIPGLPWPPYPNGFSVAMRMCLDKHQGGSYVSETSGCGSHATTSHLGL